MLSQLLNKTLPKLLAVALKRSFCFGVVPGDSSTGSSQEPRVRSQKHFPRVVFTALRCYVGLERVVKTLSGVGCTL